MPEHVRIVILGCGFGGFQAAMELDRAVSMRASFSTTLISRDNYLLFTPLLPEVAGGSLEPKSITSSARSILKNVTFLEGVVTDIDLVKKIVTVDHGARHEHSLKYDHLIIALGTVTNFFGLESVRRHAITMRTISDAIKLKNHLISNLEEAEFECCPDTPYLTVVVAGGGFAGTETAAAVNDFLRQVIPQYRHLNLRDLRIILVHAKSLICPELPFNLRAYAQRKLTQRQVEIRTNACVVDYDGETVRLEDGSTVVTRTLVWTPGNGPAPLIERLKLPKQGFRIIVDRYLQVVDQKGVWAVGDCASAIDSKTGRPYPSTAQHAIAQGKRVARNILAEITGRSKKPFTFESLGTMCQIGHRVAVSSIRGINMAGFLPWLIRRNAYLMKQPRLQDRIRIGIDWACDLIFPADLAQYQTRRGSGIMTAEMDGEPLP